MKKIIALLAVSIMAAFIMTGCVKVVKIGQEAELTGKGKFQPGTDVADMWESAVENIEKKAVELPSFLKEANGDLTLLAKKYGKYSMGTTGSINYSVKGTGTVEEVNQEKKAGYMVIKLDGYDGQMVTKIQIGSVYRGSSTRDSLDIISFGDFTNQMEWADISKHLHMVIDEKVIAPADVKNLKGKAIDFVGTFTVGEEQEMLITPVKLNVK